MANEKKQPEVQENKNSVRFNWDTGLDVPAVYATETAVQQIGGNFILAFHEVRLPPFQGVRDVDTIPQLDTTCVSRVLMPAERIPVLMKVLNETYQRFLKLVEEAE